jgi:putative transposase
LLLAAENRSSKRHFINKRKLVHGRFNWQEGYGAFSYGHSQLDRVVRYIQNQEKHHERQSFKSEYMTLLRKFDIGFEEKYVFKFIE